MTLGRDEYYYTRVSAAAFTLLCCDCKGQRKKWAVRGAWGRRALLQHMWPLRDEPAQLLWPTAQNGQPPAELSTLVFGVDGVERQEKASLTPLFIWSLFESQPSTQPVGVAKKTGVKQGFEQVHYHYHTVNVSLASVICWIIHNKIHTIIFYCAITSELDGAYSMT